MTNVSRIFVAMTLGFLLGTANTWHCVIHNYVPYSILIEQKLGYYERTTGDFKLINLEDMCDENLRSK